jgi:hypothetical protein
VQVFQQLVPADRRDTRVISIENLKRHDDDQLQRAAEQLRREVAEWRRDRAGDSWRVPGRRDEVVLFVHYTGHGVDDGVEQYIQASDLSDDVLDAVIPLSEVLTTLCGGTGDDAVVSSHDAVVVTLDCCRSVPKEKLPAAPPSFAKNTRCVASPHQSLLLLVCSGVAHVRCVCCGCVVAGSAEVFVAFATETGTWVKASCPLTTAMVHTMQSRRSGCNLQLLSWLRDMVVKLQRDELTNAWMYHSRNAGNAGGASVNTDKGIFTVVATLYVWFA